MDLRQAAQQALQAMQFAGNAHEFAAIAADLEAALAEPEQDTDCHLQGVCQRSGYSISAPHKTELERKSDAIQRLWKERDELRTLNAELVEALQRYHRIVIANAIDLDCDAAIDKAHAALAKVEASNGS